MMDADISPPPSKRRRTAAAPGEAADTVSDEGEGSIRVLSWNINGIAPFLPASSASITSYFKQSSLKERSSARTSPSSSLRGFLARHRWPEVLFLQELKISPD